MITKIRRPFWCFNIRKIENWLSYMATKSHHLVKIICFGTFLFDSGEPRQTVYSIGGFDSNQSRTLTRAMLDDGWSITCSRRAWYVAANNKPKQDIKIFPAQDEFIDHVLLILNRIMLFWSIAMTMAVFFSMIVLVLIVSRLLQFTLPPYWIIMGPLYGMGLFIILLSFISHKLLHQDKWTSLNMELPLSFEGLTVKRKLFWNVSRQA